MRPETLDEAIREAERFIKRAKACKKSVREDAFGGVWFDDGKASGAVKRSSMDLTQALADLRQGR